MNLIEELQQDLTTEFEITQKFFALYPEDKNDWKPHPKSMSMKVLSTHIAEIFGWPKFIMETEGLDFAETPYSQPDIRTKAEMTDKLKTEYETGAEVLKKLKFEDFDGRWNIRSGEMIFADWSKYQALMQMFKQITHHRAQLGVYYRLNDIFVPGSYGPSADEMEAMN